jgi:hypothetical protein
MSRIKAAKLEEWLSRENLLFLLVLLCEVILTLKMMMSHRIPRGHDMWGFFAFQYYFLNNAVTAGEIPQWAPFLTQGYFGSWFVIYLGAQAFPLQNIFCLLPGLCLKFFNYIPLFYLVFFFEQLMLLVGTWRLARRFFALPWTAAFVSLAVLGSCLWIDQPTFCCQMYCGLPLALELIHRFLETGRWRYAFLLFYFMAFQVLGAILYTIPVLVLTIFVYFLVYALTHFREFQSQIRKISWGREAWGTLILSVLPFVALTVFMVLSSKDMLFYNGRDSSTGSIPIKQFLSFGSGTRLNAAFWAELLSGISPCIDRNFYLGILTFLFMAFALFSNFRNKNLYPFLGASLLIFFFSAGSFVAIALYYLWPGISTFRNLGNALPMAKVLFCFWAGFGFESLLLHLREIHDRQKGRGFDSAGFCLILTVFTGIGGFFLFAAHAPASAFGTVDHGNCAYYLEKCRPDFLVFRNLLSGGIVLAAAGLLGLGLGPLRKFWPGIAFGLLLFQGADLYAYKSTQMMSRTRALDEKQYSLFSFQKTPFPKRRDLSFWENNPRAQLLFSDAYQRDMLQMLVDKMAPPPAALPSDEARAFESIVQQYLAYQKFRRTMLPNLALYGAEYNSYYLFFFKDQLGQSFTSSSWVKSFDDVLRAYSTSPSDDQSLIKMATFIGAVVGPFPPSLRKMAGAEEDKIQFFSKAYRVKSRADIENILPRPKYSGNQLFVLPQSADAERASRSAGILNDWGESQPADLNERLPLPYEVKRFDANHLEVEVNLTDRDAAWLYYADAWHPYWHATVNGEKTEIARAHIGYKALPIKRGLNRVHFYFGHPAISVLYAWFGLQSLAWLIYFLRELFLLARGPVRPIIKQGSGA